MCIMESGWSTVTSLLGIKYPIIQGGMVWASGAKLAAACANEGILGLIGAGSMAPELLREHIRKAQALTTKPFGVNFPLLYPKIEEQLTIALEEGVRIFFTSAGSPKKWTPFLKKNGAIVVHVCASPDLAKKCEDAGVDAVVAEGFEAGGHNGREELTTLVLIPEVKRVVSIPVIAAGGVSTGEAMAAVFALGADGVQIGSRFAVSQESSLHDAFKEAVVNAGAGDTELVLKKHIPVRLLKNSFYEKVKEMESRGASKEELVALLGKGRAKKGMHEGDVEEGELEIGQVSGLIDTVPSVSDIIKNLLQVYDNKVKTLLTL